MRRAREAVITLSSRCARILIFVAAFTSRCWAPSRWRAFSTRKDVTGCGKKAVYVFAERGGWVLSSVHRGCRGRGRRVRDERDVLQDLLANLLDVVLHRVVDHALAPVSIQVTDRCPAQATEVLAPGARRERALAASSPSRASPTALV